MTEHAALAQSSLDKANDNTTQSNAKPDALFEDAYSQDNNDAIRMNDSVDDSSNAIASMLPKFEVGSQSNQTKQDANLTDAVYRIDGPCVIEGDEDWCITDQDKDAAKAEEEEYCGDPDVDYEECEPLPPCEIIGEDIEDGSCDLGPDSLPDLGPDLDPDCEPEENEPFPSHNYPMDDRKGGIPNSGLDIDFDPNKVTNI